MKLLILDIETTSLPPKGAKWEEDFNEFPYAVQIAWMFNDTLKSVIIKPEGYTIPEESTQIHGISQARAWKEGIPFYRVVDGLVKDCLESDLIIGHNVYFDISIIKANILRYMGMGYYKASDCEEAFHKGKRIDTMRSAMKWVDARTQTGRLKFPRLEELYSRCFLQETFPAHDAGEDVKAVARCVPVLVENGIIELKRKEYPAKQMEIPFNPAKKPEIPKENPQPRENVKPEEKAENSGVSDRIQELLKDEDF